MNFASRQSLGFAGSNFILPRFEFLYLADGNGNGACECIYALSNTLLHLPTTYPTMHVLPLLPTALLPFLHQLTATALATGFQNHRSLESRQNISLSLLNAPSKCASVPPTHNSSL